MNGSTPYAGNVCSVRYNIITYEGCGDKGLCNTDNTCLCVDGYTNKGDWFDVPNAPCSISTQAYSIVHATFSAVAAAVTILCLIKFIILYKNRDRDRRSMPVILTALMTIPPFLITVYYLVAIISGNSFFKDNLALVIIVILLNISWQVSSYFINSWLITSVAKARSFSNPSSLKKSKVILRFLLSINIGNTIGAATILIATYITKNIWLFRGYTGLTTIYVITHFFPYYYSKVMEEDIMKHIVESLKMRSSSSKLDNKIQVLQSSMTSVRKSFAGTFIYFYNVIFVVFSEISSYYLLCCFAVGLLSALGCYTLFPNNGSSNDDEKSSALSDDQTRSTTNKLGSRNGTASSAAHSGANSNISSDTNIGEDSHSLELRLDSL